MPQATQTQQQRTSHGEGTLYTNEQNDAQDSLGEKPYLIWEFIQFLFNGNGFSALQNNCPPNQRLKQVREEMHLKKLLVKLLRDS